ncbi:MAG: hypothetical protein ACI4U3_08850 [Traorella sp.]
MLKINHVSIELNDDILEELLSKIFKVISHADFSATFAARLRA